VIILTAAAISVLDIFHIGYTDREPVLVWSNTTPTMAYCDGDPEMCNERYGICMGDGKECDKVYILNGKHIGFGCSSWKVKEDANENTARYCIDECFWLDEELDNCLYECHTEFFNCVESIIEFDGSCEDAISIYGGVCEWHTTGRAGS